MQSPIHKNNDFNQLTAKLGSVACSIGLAGAIVAAACAPSRTKARPTQPVQKVAAAAAAAAPATPGASRHRAPVEPLELIARTAVWFHGSDGADVLEGSEGIDLVSAYAGDDVLRGYAGDDHLGGFAGDDLLLGGTGDDSLEGAGGADRLVGGSGADVLEGGPGADVLEGGSGDDLYLLVDGFGQDVIRERADRGGRDVIELESLVRDQVQILRNDQDLVIAARDTDDRVTVAGFFTSAERRIEQVRFADGETLDLADPRTTEQLFVSLRY